MQTIREKEVDIIEASYDQFGSVYVKSTTDFDVQDALKKSSNSVKIMDREDSITDSEISFESGREKIIFSQLASIN